MDNNDTPMMSCPVAHIKASMELLNNPQTRATGLRALHPIAATYGDLGAVAADAGISRETLYQALSTHDTHSLQLLLDVLNAANSKNSA